MLSLLTVYIWLLTCAPGEQLYEHYGHTAIRVLDTERNLDLCFNYGTFSFNTDNFYYKFVRGETYYMLDVEPTEEFMYDYMEEYRPVYVQELNLPEANSMALYADLIRNSRPQNREYLYNFVYDNCSTRAYDMIVKHLPDSITSSYQGFASTSYRTAIEYYTGRGSVVNSLINMVFGREADKPMNSQERLFLPEELMNYLEHAVYSDGMPVVLGSGAGTFEVYSPPFWEKTWFYLLLFALFALAVSLYDRRRGKLSLWFDITVATVYLLLLAVVVFIVFFSIHPLVGLNWRLIVIPLIHLCARLVYIVRF